MKVFEDERPGDGTVHDALKKRITMEI